MARVFDNITNQKLTPSLAVIENPAEDSSDEEHTQLPTKTQSKNKELTICEKAIQFLEKERDLLLGFTDIRLDEINQLNAIKIANDLARLMAEKKYMKDNSNEHGYVNFEGDMYCDDGDDEENLPCRGWNGLDKRCDCGNRRLHWEYEGTFLDFINNKHTIYPDAD